MIEFKFESNRGHLDESSFQNSDNYSNQKLNSQPSSWDFQRIDFYFSFFRPFLLRKIMKRFRNQKIRIEF